MSRALARDRLALAADLPLAEAEALYRQVCGEIGWVKVGLSLFVRHGPKAVRAFTGQGARVFLDLKLHDIPNTVGLAASFAGELGVGLLTVHAQGGTAMLKAAVEGAREGAGRVKRDPPRVLAVTVLTSLGDGELAELGHPQGAGALAGRLGRLAEEAGVDGLVCSPREVRQLRQAALGPLFLCTPGIRPQGADLADQARTTTPTFAVQQGADLLVVGRPIYAAQDPAQAARALCDEVLRALPPA